MDTANYSVTSNNEVGTLAIDGWAVILVQRGKDWAGLCVIKILLSHSRSFKVIRNYK